MTGSPGEHPKDPSTPNEPGQQRPALLPAQHNANGSPTPARAGDANDPSSEPHELASFGVEQMQGCAVVVASGEIDLTNAPGLRHALTAASQVAARVVLDLNRVTFIDSSGLAVLLEAYKHRQLGHQIALCLGGTRPVVRRVLEVTHVNTMLPTYDTLAEAIAQPT